MRCGLSKRHGEVCPPGFWMTRMESERWYRTPDGARSALEKKFLSDSTHEKGNER